MKDHNRGQGHKGGPVTAPDNIPQDLHGARHGTDVKNKLDRYSVSPKETKEAGIGGSYSGSNRSIVT